MSRGRPQGATGAAMTFSQIAAATGIPRATVYRIYRGVFARMDANGIPQPRPRSRRGFRACSGLGGPCKAGSAAGFSPWPAASSEAVNCDLSLSGLHSEAQTRAPGVFVSLVQTPIGCEV
jgi:hypothetical protein